MQMSGSLIRKQSFRKKFQGYDPAEVSAFLEEIAGEFDRLRTEQEDLTLKVTELETRLADYTKVETVLQETLARAQDSSSKAVEQARKEAQLIIRDAELRAGQILDKSKNDLTALKEQVTILGAKKESIVARLRMLLNSELELVRALDAGEETAEGVEPAAEAGERKNDSSEIDDIVKSLDDR